jgi:hypothetical protein
MSEKLLDHAKVDRSAFSVVALKEADAADEAYWKSRTPDERFEASELSRQITYGYDPTTRGLSRFLKLLNSHRVEYLLVVG